MNLDTNECRLWSEVFSTEDLEEIEDLTEGLGLTVNFSQPSDISMIYFHGTVGFNDAPINCDFAGRTYGTCDTPDFYGLTVSFITPPRASFFKVKTTEPLRLIRSTRLLNCTSPFVRITDVRDISSDHRTSDGAFHNNGACVSTKKHNRGGEL